MVCKRGDIWICDLEDKVLRGSEQGGKKRFCIIISNDTGNYYSNVVTVAFITSKDKDKNKYKMQPTHTPIMLNKPSLILTEQLMTISKDRLYKFFRSATDEEMERIDKCLKVSLDL